MTRDELRDQIKTRIPCTDYLEKADNYKPPEGEGQGNPFYICPFCGSGNGPKKTGALRYYKDTNTFFCFSEGCKTGGDVITLYRQVKGVDYNTALQELAAEADIALNGGQLPPAGPQTGKDVKKKMERDTKPAATAPEPAEAPRAREIRRQIQEWEANQAHGMGYFVCRGFTPETVQKFHLGYKAQHYFHTRGGSGKNLPAIVYPYPGKDYYILRSLTFNPEEKGFYKPATADAGAEPVFNELALYAGRDNPCFIVEGPADVLSIVQTLDKMQASGSACSVVGTGIDKLVKQLQIKPNTSPLLLVLDNDAPGESASKKAADAFKEAGIRYKQVSICGSYDDPNTRLMYDPQGLEQAIGAVLDTLPHKETPQDVIKDFLQTITSGAYRPQETGIKGLDQKLGGGLVPQTLTIIGARPGAGKTVLATGICEHLARQGRKVCYHNLEMSTEQLIARSLARICRLELDFAITATEILQAYNCNPQQMDMIRQAAAIYQRDIAPNMSYNPGDSGGTVTGILAGIETAAAAEVSRGNPAPDICVDYVQITQGDPREDVKDKIGRLVMGLKDYARKYNALALAIQANNRDSYKDGKDQNEDQEARLEAGRDSSNLEYSADTVIQIMTPAKGRLSLRLVKNRFGESSGRKEDGVDLQMLGGCALVEL